MAQNAVKILMFQNFVLDYAVLLMPCQEVFWETALTRVQSTAPLSRSAFNQLFKVTYKLKVFLIGHNTAVENQCLIFFLSHQRNSEARRQRGTGRTCPTRS